MQGLPAAGTPVLHYLPIVSTVIAIAFTGVLWRHWRRSPDKRYLMWWTIGVALFGLGTLTEAVTTLFGWHEPIFRAWYIAGALLGGAPLAQGTVYLLIKRRTADRLTVALLVYVAIASVFVLTTPLAPDASAVGRLDGDAMEWQWVRLFSPLINTYALVFLVGGAIWSAVRYRRSAQGSSARVWGNWLIAIGALLPGIGGAFTRAGHVEVLYVGEMIGLILIWGGYTLIVGDRSPSIHTAQRAAYEARPIGKGAT
ncbi:MAG TPA: hypothetical protein VK960_03845 [Acidimicrobiia bacterium]|nr:hypothetical protein [Acidimicrobiia bacterium]